MFDNKTHIEKVQAALRLGAITKPLFEKPCPPCTAWGYTFKAEPVDDYDATERCTICAGRGWIKKTLAEFEDQPLPDAWPTELTYPQKLHALAHRFYARQAWEPKAGDLYTTSRADLELYEVVSIADGCVRTRYRKNPGGPVSSWPQEEFLSPDTFGLHRTHVPRWVFFHTQSAPDLAG